MDMLKTNEWVLLILNEIPDRLLWTFYEKRQLSGERHYTRICWWKNIIRRIKKKTDEDNMYWTGLKINEAVEITEKQHEWLCTCSEERHQPWAPAGVFPGWAD